MLPAPRWDADLRTLFVGDVPVKAYRVPAGNQVAVLQAFEESGWPHRLDDPLPPRPEIVIKRRLHDTIRNLNRNQHHRLIHFHGDGTGEGVTWELIDPPPNP